jgi:hypothetical protein
MGFCQLGWPVKDGGNSLKGVQIDQAIADAGI